MALNNSRLTDLAFDALVGAQSMQMHAYSAFTLVFVLNSGVNQKAVRAALSVRAAETGVIAKNTWESYVKALDVAAGKFVTHAQAELTAIRDMGEADAIDAMRQLYEGLDIQSGSDIREWSKAEGFEPLDKAAIKAARAAKAKAERDAKAAVDAAKFFAINHTDSAAISDMAPAAPVNPLDAILAAIGALGSEADVMAALGAVNDRLALMQAAKAAAPAPDAVAPVLADDAVVDARSALAAHFNKAA